MAAAGFLPTHLIRGRPLHISLLQPPPSQHPATQTRMKSTVVLLLLMALTATWAHEGRLLGAGLCRAGGCQNVTGTPGEPLWEWGGGPVWVGTGSSCWLAALPEPHFQAPCVLAGARGFAHASPAASAAEEAGPQLQPPSLTCPP